MKTGNPVQFERVVHINMSVRDMDASVNSYHKVFGTDADITQQCQVDGAQWCIVGIAGKFHFCLYEMRGKNHDPEALHINHIGFYAPDFEETIAHIKRLGIPIELDGAPVEWYDRNGTSRSLYIKDPHGYYIEFSEKLGGGLR